MPSLVFTLILKFSLDCEPLLHMRQTIEITHSHEIISCHQINIENVK